MGESFGQWIKARRQERGLTLRDVERITEGRVSNAALSQIETGKNKNPSVMKCAWLAAAYGLKGDDVLHRATAGDKPPPALEFCPHCGQLMRADTR